MTIRRLFRFLLLLTTGFQTFGEAAADSKSPSSTSFKPVFTIQPKSAIRCVGDSVTFVSNATGPGEIMYQWRHMTNIPGATEARFTIEHIRPEDFGQYFVIAYTKSKTATFSETVTLTAPTGTGWGANADGQLENPHAMTNAIAIAAGTRNALALNDDGTVIEWGHNWGPIPRAATHIISIAAGYFHSLALRQDGMVISWGEPFNPANRWMVNSNFISVSAGQFHNLALTYQGQVATWGTNAWGLARIPNAVSNIIAIAAGARHSLALRSDHTVIAWGDNSAGQTNVPDNLTDAVAIASGGEHSLALRANGTLVAWGKNDFGQCSVPSGVTNAIAIAAGTAHSVALLTDSRVIAWGDNSAGQIITPMWTTNATFHAPIRLIAAGGNFTLAESHSPTADYPVNLRAEALLIYNTNSANSSFIKDYYLSHRPRIEGISVLGVNSVTNEITDRTNFRDGVVSAVQRWMIQNGAKHPFYILMSIDLPTYFTVGGNAPGASYDLAQSIPGVKPSVFYLNMGSVEATRAYIDKLERFGTNSHSRSPIISASAQGYGNTNFLFDGSRHGKNFDDADFSQASRVVMRGFEGVNANARGNLTCQFCDDVETNFIAGKHLTSGANLAGYMSWGVHSSLGLGYATNSFLKWSGHSSWWIIETVESFNGANQNITFQGNFPKWFSRNAFGGTDYSNTPVGAVGHVLEPGLGGINDPNKYFGLWARGKKFAVAASSSQSAFMRYYIIFGDPFVRR